MNESPSSKRRKTVNADKRLPKISKKDVELGFDALYKNMDPCMQTKWRREPFPLHPLTTLAEYQVAEDAEDGEVLRSGLKTELQGQHPDLMAVISSLPVHSTIQLTAFPQRCQLGRDVEEQCVWGIDCFTRRLLFDCLKLCPELMTSQSLKSEKQEIQLRSEFIERRILPALNRLGKDGWDMFRAMELIRDDSSDSIIQITADRILQLMQCLELSEWSPKPLTPAIRRRILDSTDNFRSHPKGQGVICMRPEGLPPGTFVEEYLGELYTPWRWFERQDVIKKRNPDGYLPDFYNIQIERPKDDAKGFGVIFVEAANKGNFASRLCHSCKPNCRMLSLTTEGRITNAIFTLRHVDEGEELTWDYSCVTESEKEYRAAICLCGTDSCRGSFLHFAHSSAFQDVMSKKHNILNRTSLLLRACQERFNEEDKQRLEDFGIRSFALQFSTNPAQMVPDWLMKWTSLVLEFIEFEHQALPEMLTKDSRNYTPQSARIEANGVRSNRLQNLVITIDKAKYFLRNQPHQDPPLQLLTDDEILEFLWTGENSVLQQAIQEIKEHHLRLKQAENAFKKQSKSDQTETKKTNGIPEHSQISEALKFCKSCSPSTPSEARTGLQHLARLLRSSNSVHLALHDILMLKSRTQYFFKRVQFKTFLSAEVKVSETEMVSSSNPVNDQSSTKKKAKNQELVAKNYSPEFLWGQLTGWFKQSVYSPAASLSAERRGSVSLPSIENCYSQPVMNGNYELKQRVQMLKSMEQKPDGQWPTGTIFSFRNQERIYGTPMLDAAIEEAKDLPNAGQALQELIDELRNPDVSLLAEPSS